LAFGVPRLAFRPGEIGSIGLVLVLVRDDEHDLVAA
jgi:hypothetical protein